MLVELETKSLPDSTLSTEEVASSFMQAATKALEGGDRYLYQIFLILLVIILPTITGCAPESTQAPPTQQTQIIEAAATSIPRPGKKLSAEELTAWNEFAKEYLFSNNDSCQWSFGVIEGFSFSLIRRIDASTADETFYPGLDDITQYGNQPIGKTDVVVGYSRHYYDLYTKLLSVLNLTTQQMLDIRNAAGLNGLRDAIKQKLAENQQLSEEELDKQANQISFRLAYYFSTADDIASNRQAIETILDQLGE